MDRLDAANCFSGQCNQSVCTAHHESARKLNVHGYEHKYRFKSRGSLGIQLQLRHPRRQPSDRPKTLFTNAFIPARFGAPYTTKLYGTNTVPGKYTPGFPARTGTNGIQDGYDIISYLADMPFTQEFISVKLCRLFVHDDFPNPSNDPNNPAYDFYNYAAGNLSPEAQLVRDCMSAWENNSPKGQLRPRARHDF